MDLSNLTILIRGAGEMASGVAWRLFQSHFQDPVDRGPPTPGRTPGRFLL